MDIELATKGILDSRQKVGAMLKAKVLDPDGLSLEMGRMNIYAAYVSDELGKIAAEREETKAALYLDLLKSGKSATGADNYSRAEVAHLTSQERILELLYQSTNNTVGVIQSRLKAYVNEARSQQ